MNVIEINSVVNSRNIRSHFVHKSCVIRANLHRLLQPLRQDSGLQEGEGAF